MFRFLFSVLRNSCFTENNVVYLHFCLGLTDQDGIVVVCLIGSDFGPHKFCLNKLLCNLFQRLAIPFIHSEEEERQHEEDHADGGHAGIAAGFEQKERRDTDQCTRPKAEKLTFCQVEQDLGFDPRQITRDRNIGCHDNLNLLL